MGCTIPAESVCPTRRCIRLAKKFCLGLTIKCNRKPQMNFLASLIDGKIVFVVELLSHVWLCDHTDYSLPGSSVHRISQVRILEWVAISVSRGSSQPRDWTHISCIGGQILYQWATWEAQMMKCVLSKMNVMLCSWDLSERRDLPRTWTHT